MVLKLNCATSHLSLCWINTVIINKTLCSGGSGLSVDRWLRALGRYLPKGTFLPVRAIRIHSETTAAKAPMAYGPVNIDWYFNYRFHNLIINHKHYSFTFLKHGYKGTELQNHAPWKLRMNNTHFIGIGKQDYKVLHDDKSYLFKTVVYEQMRKIIYYNIYGDRFGWTEILWQCIHSCGAQIEMHVLWQDRTL